MLFFLSDFLVRSDGDIARASRPVEQSKGCGVRIGNQPNVEIGIHAQRQTAERIVELSAATEHARHETLRGDFAEVVGAADADGGKRGLHAVGLLVHITDGAGDGAEAALDQAHGGAVLLTIGCLETVVADFEDGVGLECDDGAVGETQLRVAVSARGDAVAHEDIGAPRQGPACAIQGG